MIQNNTGTLQAVIEDCYGNSVTKIIDPFRCRVFETTSQKDGRLISLPFSEMFPTEDINQWNYDEVDISNGLIYYYRVFKIGNRSIINKKEDI